MRLCFCVLALLSFALLQGCGGGNDNTYNPTLVHQGISFPETPARTFALEVTPRTAIVTAGQSAVYTVTVRASGGFTDTIQLSLSGLPGETDSVFSPVSVTPTTTGTASILTVITTAAGTGEPAESPDEPTTTPPAGEEPGSLVGTIRSAHRATSLGTATLTITATGGGITRTATVQLAVVAEEQQLTVTPTPALPGTRFAMPGSFLSAWLLARKNA